MATQATLQAGAAEGRARKPIGRYAVAAARVVQGLTFLVMGLNGFLYFLPQPSTPLPEGTAAFLGALVKTGYMIPLVSGTQVIVGALLLSNRFVPLTLALIAPVIVHIIAFHIFLSPAAMWPAVVVLGLEIYLAWAYRNAYRPLLVRRAAPGSG